MEEEEDEENGFEMEDDEERRFMCAREGDHVMSIPFECDVCHFRNITGRDVDWGNSRDIYTLTCIRGASLDAMWSKEKDTVEGNWRRMRLDLKNALPKLSVGPLFPKMGNPEVEDKVGMNIAVITLNTSLRPGKHAGNIQWDSMRKTPTWYAHAHQSIVGGEEESIYAADNKKMYATSCPTRSRWFSAFLLGAKKRMGVIRKQDEALTVKQLLALLDIAEQDWQAATDPAEKKRLEEVAAFICIGYCASLRGEEISLTSIQGMLEFWDESINHPVVPHIMVTLRGRFKAEKNLRWHMIPIAIRTRSDIPSLKWVTRLMKTRVTTEGARTGPLFAQGNGKRAKISQYDGDFRSLLERAREAAPKLFSTKVKIEDYSLRRSLRRGSTTEAQNNKVPDTTIQLINRWRKVEAAKGTVPGLPMRQVYTEAQLAIQTTVRYSLSL